MINESKAANTGNQLNQVQLKPTSEASQRFLAKHVGEIQRVVVVEVSERPNRTVKAVESDKKTGAESKAIIYDVVLKIGSKKITVESPVMPRIGQEIEILVINHKQIKLIKVLDRQAQVSSYNKTQTGVNNNLSATTNASTVKTMQQDALITGKTVDAQRQAVIQNALRRHLPRAYNDGDISALIKKLDKLPNINPSLTSSILHLKQSINQLTQLTDPLLLARAIQNSGILFESKLNQLLSSGDKISIEQLLSLGLIVNAEAKQTKTSDYKLALLNLIGALNHYRGPLVQTEKAHMSPINLDELWNTVSSIMSRTDALSTNISDKDQDILPLLRMLLSLVSRVQGQQLSTLSQTPSPDNTNSLLFELPVWIDEKISMLELRLEWDQKNKKNRNENERIWRAKLCFDISEAGKIISLISLRGKKCSAVFWVPNADIEIKVTHSLENLKDVLTQQGIVVDKLQCMLGIPHDNTKEMTITNLLDTSI